MRGSRQLAGTLAGFSSLPPRAARLVAARLHVVRTQQTSYPYGQSFQLGRRSGRGTPLGSPRKPWSPGGVSLWSTITVHAYSTQPPCQPCRRKSSRFTQRFGAGRNSRVRRERLSTPDTRHSRASCPAAAGRSRRWSSCWFSNPASANSGCCSRRWLTSASGLSRCCSPRMYPTRWLSRFWACRSRSSCGCGRRQPRTLYGARSKSCAREVAARSCFGSSTSAQMPCDGYTWLRRRPRHSSSSSGRWPMPQTLLLLH